MEIHVTDDRLGGWFRRYQLAIRMMSHGARTQTVIAWSDLTRDQLFTQRRRWGFAPEIRPKGPAPSAFHVFFKSKRAASEAAVFASLCHILGAVTAELGNQAARIRPCLENGELFCEALEVFRDWLPEAQLDFERALQLATGVVHAEDVTLGWCSDCRCAMLFEGCRRAYANCGHCLPERSERSPSARQQADQGVPHDDEQPKPERHPDHVPDRELRTRSGDPKEDRDRDAEQHQSGTDGLDYRREHGENGQER